MQIYLSAPMVADRHYKTMSIRDCPVSAMSTFTTVTMDTDECRDQWEATMPLQTVLGGCGFRRYNQVTRNGTLYEVRGRHMRMVGMGECLRC